MKTSTIIKYNEKGDLVITIPKRIAKKYEDKIIVHLFENIEKAKHHKTAKAKWEKDPIKDIIGICESGVSNGSIKHDKYLYRKIEG